MRTTTIGVTSTRVLSLLTLLFSLGCSDSSSDTPTPQEFQLAITYGGEPPLQGRVTLIGAKNQILLGEIGPDGIARFPATPNGTVQVGIVNYPGASGFKSTISGEPKFDLPGRVICRIPPQPVIRFPDRYAEPSTSGLTLTVAPGQERAELAVPRNPDDPPVIRKADIPDIGINVGQIAPEISGEDIDGTPFRLSDYRGKVVALMFWGHWCKLCRDRYPEEIATMKRLEKKPFAILGINTDSSREVVRRENKNFGTHWRTWWDGPMIGPVISVWDAQGLPYVVLIDHAGVIRHRSLEGLALDHAIDELIAKIPPKP